MVPLSRYPAIFGAVVSSAIGHLVPKAAWVPLGPFCGFVRGTFRLPMPGLLLSSRCRPPAGFQNGKRPLTALWWWWSPGVNGGRGDSQPDVERTRRHLSPVISTGSTSPRPARHHWSARHQPQWTTAPHMHAVTSRVAQRVGLEAAAWRGISRGKIDARYIQPELSSAINGHTSRTRKSAASKFP